MGRHTYTPDELIQSLKQLYEKYNTVPTSTIIDKERNFPSRNSFVRTFGSLNKALIAAGFPPHRPNIYTMEYAQKELDKRNGYFQILSFKNCREKATVKCKSCGFIWDVAIYSLYDNKRASHGCPNCTKENTFMYEYLDKNSLSIIENYKKGKKKFKCNKCGYEFVGHFNSKLRCQNCSRVDIYQYKLKKLLDQTIASYYILGFIMSDGSIHNNQRLVITINKKDIEILNFIKTHLSLENPIKVKDNTATLSCADTYTIQKLIDNYSIKHNKTYVPCNIKNIPTNFFIPFETDI